MTVINGIEIDDIHYETNVIKYAIINNEPIEKKLNVIIVISNPCMYATRYILLKEFISRIEAEETNVNLYVVELIYENQRFIVTDKKNKKHLQIKTTTPIWHKENMINLGVKYLLPANWKALAWIDADVEFESSTWALDTLKVLNGTKDVVQIFSHCIDMDKNGESLNIFNSFGFSFAKNKKYVTRGLDYWHPGYAWAITRKAFDKLGGIYDKGILGSGDNIFALSIIQKAKFMNNISYHDDYNQSMLDYQEKTRGLRLGYIPGVIRHHYHGKKINRRYIDRTQILKDYQYSPNIHTTYDSIGILIPTENFNEEFKKSIYNYFEERKEDE